MNINRIVPTVAVIFLAVIAVATLLPSYGIEGLQRFTLWVIIGLVTGGFTLILIGVQRITALLRYSEAFADSHPFLISALGALLLVQLAFIAHPIGPEIVGFGAGAAAATLLGVWKRLG